jgi:hypothetical protein
MLDDLDIQYRHREQEVIYILFETLQYRNPEGEPTLWMIISLDENGEYFKLFAPNAFTADGNHPDIFLKACLVVQWRTKLIQFEYDDTDGEIRPIIEFPIEDGSLTVQQLKRCIGGMVELIDEYAPFLERALEEGVIEQDGVGEEEEMVELLSYLFEGFPEEVIGEALRKAERRRRE